LPVLGAAGGNVGVALQAKRSAHSASNQRVGAARRSWPITVFPRPPTPVVPGHRLHEHGIAFGTVPATLRGVRGKVKIGDSRMLGPARKNPHNVARTSGQKKVL
jgi:hypothetical protein